jgi:sphingomyelin phosphodiesterase
MMNLTDNNLNPGNSARWVLEYNAKQAYNMPDLSPQSWYNVAQNMYINNTVMQQFYTFHYTSNVGNTTCTGDCATDLFCGVTSSSLTGKCMTAA